MNMKPIDLQVAFNRSNEAGNIQNQLNQKPVQDQYQALHSTMKQQENMRKTTTKADETDKTAIRDDEQTQSRSQQEEKPKKETSSEQRDIKNEAVHPYKGRHIDFTL